MDSETVKNPFDYQKPNDENVAKIEALREDFKVLFAKLNELPDSRENSLAKTKLEECAMWAIKGIVFSQ